MVGALALILIAIIFLPVRFEQGLKSELKLDWQDVSFTSDVRFDSTQDKPPLPSAWVIQIGKAISQPNADILKDQLRQAGLAAFTRQIEDGNLVQIGLTFDKEQAEADPATLKSQLSLEIFVTSYQG